MQQEVSTALIGSLHVSQPGVTALHNVGIGHIVARRCMLAPYIEIFGEQTLHAIHESQLLICHPYEGERSPGSAVPLIVQQCFRASIV